MRFIGEATGPEPVLLAGRAEGPTRCSGPQFYTFWRACKQPDKSDRAPPIAPRTPSCLACGGPSGLEQEVDEFQFGATLLVPVCG